MDILNWLFADYVNDDIYFNSEITANMTKEQRSACKEIKRIVGEDTYLRIEEFISASEAASEKYGFLHGFTLAKKLLLS